MADRTRQSVLFEDLTRKPVHIAFDAECLSSEGGTTLLASVDRRIGLTERLVSTLTDRRQQGKVSFGLAEMLRQRVYSIALGYEDQSDANTLSSDPMLKLAIGRDPRSGEDLAKQSTLSRFENTPTAREIVEMGRCLEEFVIDRLARERPRAKTVTIDLDSTVDPTHGGQQLTLFNGFYDTYCYLPLLGFLSIDDEPDQNLFHARMRPGNARCYRSVIPTLRRTVALIRRKFRKARVMVRMDGGFYHPRVLEVLDELKVVYVVGMAKNAVLSRIAGSWMTIGRTLAAREDRTTTLFGEGRYRARSWPCKRRVVLKAEVLHFEGRSLKDNERFVITNRDRMSPEKVYRWYCQRGDSENRIKELKRDLAMDRTSCTRFVANQFRVLMTSAAYVLFQDLRWRLRRTKAARSSVGKLRRMLLKIAVRVVTSCRRIVCHLPTHVPWSDIWRVAARSCGAKLA
jgi:hypothetical protein